MSAWIYVLPLLAAAIGWGLVSILLQFLFHPLQPKKIAGRNWQGVIPARQQLFAIQAGKFSASLLSIAEIEEKIAHPDNVKKIMPQAEAHIDHFLRVKLVKSMPVVGMFVGDKTINNLKTLFIAELEQLFPEIMKNYMEGLKEDFNIEKIVTAKIAAYSPLALEQIFRQQTKKERTMVKVMGAVLGAVIGLIQLALMLLLPH